MRPFARPIAAAILLLAASASHALTIRVGPVGDPACDENRLIDALGTTAGNPGPDTILVANSPDQYPNTLGLIGGQDVVIEGGYSNCSATTPSGRTTLRGSDGTLPPFVIANSSGSNQVTLRNLDIIGGLGPVQRRGGAMSISGSYVVTLDNTLIRDSRAGYGGGIYIRPGSTSSVILLGNSGISNNTALVSGGGIFCSGTSMVALQRGGLFGNEAASGSTSELAGRGGGAALVDGCRLSQDGAPGFNQAFGNTAAEAGGAYYLRNASLFITGTPTNAAMVMSNEARNGGAIAVDDDTDPGAGPASMVTIRNAWIEDNYAQWQGGAIAMLRGGTLSMGRSLAGNLCHTATLCSSLSFNGVPFGGDAATARGGALYVGTGARATVYSTIIEGNEGVVSSVLWQLGTGQARIDSSLLTDNLGTLLVGNNLRNSELVLSWSTVTRNRLASGNYLVSASNETGGRVKVFGSVLGEAITYGVYPLGAPLTADCVARDPAMAALSGTASRELELAAPYNVSSSGHILDDTALPVDFCDQSLAPRVGGDLDGQTAIGDAPRPDSHGRHDLGADEVVYAASDDRIFADGFEA